MATDWQRLQDRYRSPGAKNVRRDEAVRRAIRAELVGGEDLLEAMQLVHRLRTRLQGKQLDGIHEAKAAETALAELRNIFAGEILRRYESKEDHNG